MHCGSKAGTKVLKGQVVVCISVNKISCQFSVFGEKLGAVRRERMCAGRRFLCGGDSLHSPWIHEKQGMKRYKYLEIFHLPRCLNISIHCSVLWGNKKQSLWFVLSGWNGMKKQMWCWLSARLLAIQTMKWLNFQMVFKKSDHLFSHWV